MKANFKNRNYGDDLTLAQLWKARRAQEKLVNSQPQSQKHKRKEAA